MNSSAKQILIGWIYRRIGFLKRGMKKQIKPLAAILRFLDFSPPILSFRAQREIFLALCSFLLLSQKVSPFPLSHIGRYTGVPKRSLGFARDDVTGIALSKHIRCTLREINPSPHPLISSAVKKSSLHSALSCSLHRSIPVFCFHTYNIIPSCKKDPSTSLGMTLRKRRFPNISFIRDVGYPSPIPSFRAQREIFLAFRSFLLSSQKVSPFPLSHIRRYTGVPERSLHFARDDDTEVAFPQHILYTGRGLSIPPYRHFQRSEKSSLHSALSCSFHKRFPLFRCLT